METRKKRVCLSIMSAHDAIMKAIDDAMKAAASVEASAVSAFVENTPARGRRCAFLDCRAKLTLSRTPCACAKTFCLKHAFAKDHDCSVDYIAKERKRRVEEEETATKRMRSCENGAEGGGCAF